MLENASPPPFFASFLARARVRANGISAQPLCTYQETRSRSKPERARERSSERARELASERARERKSERAREQERERAGERESERAGERVSEAAKYHLNGSFSKRGQSELRSYREPSLHSNRDNTLCINCWRAGLLAAGLRAYQNHSIKAVIR